MTTVTTWAPILISLAALGVSVWSRVTVRRGVDVARRDMIERQAPQFHFDLNFSEDEPGHDVEVYVLRIMMISGPRVVSKISFTGYESVVFPARGNRTESFELEYPDRDMVPGAGFVIFREPSFGAISTVISARVDSWDLSDEPLVSKAKGDTPWSWHQSDSWTVSLPGSDN